MSNPELEKRVYNALLKVAKVSSSDVRTLLAMCVMFGTPYEKVRPEVLAVIRQLITEAKL